MRALTLALALLGLAAAPAKAGPRTDHWSGFDVGFGATPFPSVAGGMIGFNVGDAARLSIGYGSFTHWVTYQLDAKFFLAEGAWAPFIGTGLNYLVGQRAKFLIWDIPFDKGFIPYIESGLDFQSDIGVHVCFTVGLGVPGGTLIILPGVAMGWYF